MQKRKNDITLKPEKQQFLPDIEQPQKPFTEEDFEDALRKVSRRDKPSDKKKPKKAGNG